MTEFLYFKAGYSPSFLQRKYSLTYVKGVELAEEFKKLHDIQEQAVTLIKDGRFIEALRVLENEI